MKRERELLTELLELVQKRSFVIESLDEDRLRLVRLQTLKFYIYDFFIMLVFYALLKLYSFEIILH